MTCLADGDQPAAADPSLVGDGLKPTGGRVEGPKKLRDVRPHYPAAARNARVQGSVVLEAEITPSGCVGSLRIVEAVAPSLDWEAMRTVVGWQYTPTLLHGQAVPVIMTVTVNFRLSR